MPNIINETVAYAADLKPAQRRGGARWREICRRAFDIGIALALLVLLSGLVVWAALKVRAFDGGPAFYRHTRIGRGGKKFACLKIRTMRQDADAGLERALAESPSFRQEWELNRKLANDPRVLGQIGRRLRAASIDEIPQLWNVLRGDMSIVGPRPIVEEELRHYGVYSSSYLSVRPGITGLWQVSGRSETSYSERVLLDVEYARRPSLRAYFGILMKTVPIVLGRRGAV